ncbi:hypothetical protein PC128_g22325 [Phytophthora cactorum]|nr:hypothetical protein PC128_g22325 [Phytophthora cactorum]
MRTLESREATYERMSLSALAAKICALSCDADRQCCFVHHVESCESCRGCGVSLPSASGWRCLTSETPLSDSEHRENASYQHALQDYTRAQDVWRGSGQCPVGNLPPLRGLPRTPPRSPEHRPAGLREAPSYRPSDPASAQAIHGAEGFHHRGDGCRDFAGEWHDYHRGEGSPPRFGGRYLPGSQEDQEITKKSSDPWKPLNSYEKVTERRLHTSQSCDPILHGRACPPKVSTNSRLEQNCSSRPNPAAREKVALPLQHGD